MTDASMLALSATLRTAAARASRHGIHEPARVDAEVATKARDISTILTERAAWARLSASASASALKHHGYVPAGLAFNADLLNTASAGGVLGHGGSAAVAATAADDDAAAVQAAFHREMDDDLMFEWDA